MTVMDPLCIVDESMSVEVGPDWHIKLTKSGNVPTGSYKMFYCARLNGNKIGAGEVSTKFVEAKLEISGPGIAGTYEIDSRKFWPTNNEEIRNLSGHIDRDLSGGNYTLTLSFRAEDATQTVRIDKARITVEKH